MGFRVHAEGCPQGCIELAVLRHNREKAKKRGDHYIEVLMFERPLGDPWEGQLHMPGTTLYMFDAESGDRCEKMWARLAAEINSADLSPKTAHYLDTHLTTHAKRERGPCMHNIHVIWSVNASESFPKGTWHHVRELPEHTIDHHVDMINKIVKAGDLGQIGFW